MGSKKMLFITLAIFVFVIGLLYIVTINTTNVAKFYNAEVYVYDDGEINVKETIVIDFKSYVNYLYRDLVLSNSHGKAGILDKENLKVKVYQGDIIDSDEYEDITENVSIGYSYNEDKTRYGEDIECPCEPEYCPDNCESIYIDAGKHGSFEGLYSYEIEYNITNMVSVYNDCAEINYRLFEYLGFETEVAAATVFLPAHPHSKDEIYAYGHGLYNGFVEVVSNREFAFVGEDVAADEMLEFRIVFPNDILLDKNDPNAKFYVKEIDNFEKIIETENLLTKQSNRLYNICTTVDIITALWVIGMVIATVIVYIKVDKEFEPKFDGEYYRELPNDYPPAVMSYLYYFQKTNDEDFTATVLNLIRKKVCKLDCLGDMNDKDCDYKLTINTEKTREELNETLASHEIVVINWLFGTIGNGSEVTFEQIENYGKTLSQANDAESFNRKFRSNIEYDAKKQDFFIDSAKGKFLASLPGYITIGAALIILAVMIMTGAPLVRNIFAFAVVAIIFLLYVSNIKKRSIEGNEQYHKWKAFKNFLEDFGSLKDCPVLSIEIWEEYLAYATSLKIADKVMDQLSVKLPELNADDATYLAYTSTRMRSRYFIYHRINRSYSRVHTNSSHTIMEHNARNRSGGGRSGGFSGGSSFGGGGGGFRSGR